MEENKPEIIETHIRLKRPVPDEISSPYGMREHPITGKEKMHKGIYFATPFGSPVRAMASGHVFRAGLQDPDDPSKGYGLRLWQKAEIEGVEFYLWYGHLSEVVFKEGDAIAEGSIVGISGNSGESTGPHLHVSARKVNTGDFYNMEFYNTKERTV